MRNLSTHARGCIGSCPIPIVPEASGKKRVCSCRGLGLTSTSSSWFSSLSKKYSEIISMTPEAVKSMAVGEDFRLRAMRVFDPPFSPVAVTTGPPGTCGPAVAKGL